MSEGDRKSKFDEGFMYLSISCLSVAFALSNAVFKVKHTWILGWFGCLIALVICRFSPDLHMRVIAARISGLGICVAFYVTDEAHDHRAHVAPLSCSVPLEVVVMVAFFAHRWRETALT